MAIETIAEFNEPGPGRGDPAVRTNVPADATQAFSTTAAIRQLPDEHPEIAKEIRECLRTWVHLDELPQHHKETKKSATEPEQRRSSLALRFDPDGCRILGFGLSAVITGATPPSWSGPAGRSWPDPLPRLLPSLGRRAMQSAGLSTQSGERASGQKQDDANAAVPVLSATRACADC